MPGCEGRVGKAFSSPCHDIRIPVRTPRKAGQPARLGSSMSVGLQFAVASNRTASSGRTDKDIWRAKGGYRT